MIQKFAIYKSAEWFKANTAIDDWGDYYWESSLERDRYENLLNNTRFDKEGYYNSKEEYDASREGISTECPGLMIAISTDEIEDEIWGILKIISKEDDPEYFV